MLAVARQQLPCVASLFFGVSIVYIIFEDVPHLWSRSRCWNTSLWTLKAA